MLHTVGAALLLSPRLVHAQPLPLLRSCNLQRQDAGLRLRLALSTQVAYRSFSLSNPARLVIDLSGISAQRRRWIHCPKVSPSSPSAAARMLMGCAWCSIWRSR
ncbi:hypothetical protein XPR_1812 [Xanthomonas arboricola pv. pruni MAFF 301420]|uniref:AMIN domain-containing protein n=1 Tax=Xanthomonas arboricola pv. pruni MAFF 301420 TaxID=1418095 RepID=W4SFK7_9XANT|nr:hypothetical protein XPR_1812 [Xanthomonas arboricola pv. pruni MAFF 301420]GAE62136.1 hypothetical protein XPN_4042 [Xanthomonas arboricola pv. pruni MAFF 301427]